MNKISVCRLIFSALGILCLVAWTNPAPYTLITSNLDDQEEIIRERIPTAVTIVNPIYNPAVRSYLDTYLYRRPQQTAAMIGWAAVYFPMFEKALAEEGLPTDLKYLSIIESALNPVAISRSGAGGLWQFMKPTARECGLKISSYVDERMDPEKSTKAAVLYLKQLYAMFGNWELVMAAYNAGPGRVRSAVKRAGSSDYWKIARFLPEETRSYVPGFIAASYLMNFHDAHNIIPVYPEHAMGDLDTIMIYEGMSITEVSKRSGLPIDIVKQLNPCFIRNYIPISAAGYSLILPFSAAEAFNSGRMLEVPDLAFSGESATVTIEGKTYKITTKSKEHVVRSGDNLYTLASRNGCSVRELMDWNGLRSSHLAIGQRLEIRFTAKELVTATPVVAVVVPVTPMRQSQQCNTLACLTPEYLPVDHRATTVTFEIAPVIKTQSTNTLVLQRRQSVRQALYQQANGNVDLQTCSLPANLCTGDVVRMK